MIHTELAAKGADIARQAVGRFGPVPARAVRRGGRFQNDEGCATASGSCA